MSIILWLFPDFSSYKKARRFMRLVIGGTVLVLGIVLMVLPGPAFIVIPLGLAILAGEFVWAKVLLRRVRYHINKMQNDSDSPG